MARRLIEAGRDTGDTTVPGMDSMCHNIHRWEHGRGGLTERYKLHYCHAFGITPDQFGADPAVSKPSGATLAAPPPNPQLPHLPHDLAGPRPLIPLPLAYPWRTDPPI